MSETLCRQPSSPPRLPFETVRRLRKSVSFTIPIADFSPLPDRHLLGNFTTVMAETTPAPSQPNSNNSTNSSLQSWQRFHLDPKDRRKILVYEYRHGVETSSQEELCLKLEKGKS